MIKALQKLLGDNMRFVFRHFPTVGNHPRRGGRIGRSGRQVLGMHDELFAHQQALDDHDLLRYGQQIGLDVERLGRDMAENTFLKIIEANYNQSFLTACEVLGPSTLTKCAIRARLMSRVC